MEISVAPVFMPGPRPNLILGWRGGIAQFVQDPIGFMSAIYRAYGRVVALSRSAPVLLFAFGPSYNRQLLSDSELFYSNPNGGLTIPPGSAMQRITSGLLAMNGATHKQQRRLMMPAFHKKQIACYRDAMVEITQRVLDGWRPGARLDIAREMQQLTMAVALKTLFSLDTTPEALELARMFKQSLEIDFSFLDRLLQVDLPGTKYSQLLRLSEQIERRVLALIQQRRALASGMDDVLAMLIGARDDDGTSMTDAELIGQTYTLFAAGHETSSNALTWTLFLLDQHPDVQANLLDELDSVLHGEAPAVEQIERLPLLDRVVKESLRLLPPASVGARISTAPFTLQCYELPAASTVFYSPYITHRLPELYPQPQKFLPERWEAAAPSPYEYLPFGAGPRMCIGATFATIEIKIVLAMLLQRYRLALAPGAQIDRAVRITLQPEDGLPMLVAPQDRQFTRGAVQGTIREMVDLAV